MFGFGRKVQQAVLSDLALERIAMLEHKAHLLTETLGYRWRPPRPQADWPELVPEGDADDRITQARSYESEVRRLVAEADERGRRLDALLAKLEQQLGDETEPPTTKAKTRRMTI